MTFQTSSYLHNNLIFFLISYFILVYLHTFKCNRCLQVLGQFTVQFIDLLEDVFDVADSPTECFMGFPDSQRSEATWLLSIAAHTRLQLEIGLAKIEEV